MLHESCISIFGKKTNLKKEFIGNISQNYYRLLKRYIRVEQNQNLQRDLKFILYEHGWLQIPPKTKNITNYIDSINIHSDIHSPGIIYNAIVQSRVSTVFLENLFNLQEKFPELFSELFRILIDSNEIFNISNDLSEVLTVIMNGNYRRDVKQFINKMWDVKLSVAGNSIGSGEVCLTLLTGAVKANIGDLKLLDNSREVEVKGIRGKLGSQYYADSSVERLSNILKLTPKQFQIQIIKLKEQQLIDIKIIKIQKELREKREMLKNKIIEAEINVRKQINERKKQQLKVLNSQENIIKNIDIVNNFIYDIGNIEVPETGSGTNISTSELTSLKRLYTELKELKNTKICIKETNKKFTFTQAVQGYFINNIFQLSTIQLIEGFFQIRNYKMNSDDQSAILKSLYAFFFKYPIQYLTEAKTFNKLVITLHALCYWFNSTFTDIIFVNDKTKNCFILHFPQNRKNIASAFEFIYNQIPEELRSTLSLGGQNPAGVEVILEK